MLSAAVLRDSWRSWVANDYRPAGPAWLQWLWTALFCVVLAAGLTMVGFAFFASGEGAWRNAVGWWHWYSHNLFMCLVIGVVIHMLFFLGHRLLGERRTGALAGWERFAFYSGVPIVGVLVGWPLAYAMLGRSIVGWFSGERANVAIGLLLISVLLTLVLYQVFEAKARQIGAERRAAETQLRLLQAQIEPHFLFNTLANVLSLIESDAPRARRMLEAFTDYLRSSLGELRRADVALDEELALANAYLQIQQMRMDDRLRVEIDADDAARRAAVPPLSVQPLVENAIQHGLEPKVEGGTVRVLARREGEQLVIDIDDDGLGLRAEAARGNGVALANLRERLAARFGSAARLTLEARSPGTRCRLELPYRLHA